MDQNRFKYKILTNRSNFIYYLQYYQILNFVSGNYSMGLKNPLRFEPTGNITYLHAHLWQKSFINYNVINKLQ